MPSLRSVLAFAFLLGLAGEAVAGPFTADSVVVYRVGEAGGTLSGSTSKVFLDEFSSSGTLLQSIELPSVGGTRLTALGTEPTEGFLTRSADQRYLLLMGYDANVGSGTFLTSRVIGRVDVKTGAYVRTNALTDFTTDLGHVPRSVASDDGSRFWITGSSGGIRYVGNVGDTTSTQLSGAPNPTDLRQVNIVDGQLYVSTNSGSSVRIGTVGTGLPTTPGQAITNLSGLPTTGSPYSFVLADLDTGVAGVDTLYVADDDATSGGIKKFSLVSGAWVLNGTVGNATDSYRGLTVAMSEDSVTLFATRKGGTTGAGGGEVVSLIDTAGYNANFSSSSFALLGTAASGTAYRGIAYLAVVPEPNTLVLGGLIGLLGCGAYLRRRRS